MDYYYRNKLSLPTSWTQFKDHFINVFTDSNFTIKQAKKVYEYKWKEDVSVEANKICFKNLMVDGCVSWNKDLLTQLISKIPYRYRDKLIDKLNFKKNSNASIDEFFEILNEIDINLSLLNHDANVSVDSSVVGAAHLVDKFASQKTRNTFCKYFLAGEKCLLYEKKKCNYLHSKRLFYSLKEQINTAKFEKTSSS